MNSKRVSRSPEYIKPNETVSEALPDPQQPNLADNAVITPPQPAFNAERQVSFIA